MKGVFSLNYKPKALNKGDTVGVIAPASPPDPKKLDTALLFLEEPRSSGEVGQGAEKPARLFSGTG